jgi:hypothetical protein
MLFIVPQSAIMRNVAMPSVFVVKVKAPKISFAIPWKKMRLEDA